MCHGDPLSPYLFALCLERLSQLIDHAVSNKQWLSFPITRNGPLLSHVFYAGDLVLIGQATEENTKTIMECLNIFCSISGQKVNSSKSKLFFSNNSSPNARVDVCRITGMEATNELGSHLGVTLHSNRVSEATFQNLITRMQARLSQWKASKLSLAGRQILVQSITSTLASHVMQCVKILIGVCDSLDKIQRDFLWGSNDTQQKIHLVRWERVCKPKDQGGLGIRTSRNMNQAFLAKIGWKLCLDDQSLWAKVLKAKYFSNGSFLQLKKKMIAHSLGRAYLVPDI